MATVAENRLADISPENQARLEAALSKLEKSRHAYFRNLVATYMSLLMFGPLAVVALLVANKNGLLHPLRPVFLPIMRFLALIPWPHANGYRSSRALGRLYMYIIGGIAISPVFLLRRNLNKRYDADILPVIFDELGIPYHRPGTLNFRAIQPLFRSKPSFAGNLLSVDGQCGTTPFTAHVAKLQRMEQSWYSSTPSYIVVFEGVIVEITLPQPAPVYMVLTFQKTTLSDERLTPVPLTTPELEAAFSAYADNPAQAATLLKPDFLTDLLVFNETAADLPPMEIHLHKRSLILFIPSRQRNWLARCRLSINAQNLDPIRTMVRSWRMLEGQLDVFKTYLPQLFEEEASPASQPRITRRRKS